MNRKIFVIKRNGKQEALSFVKIQRILSRASQNLNNICTKKIEESVLIQIFHLIETQQIHAMLIKCAADLISAAQPNYQYVAARLAIFQLRKKAYGTFMPPKLYSHVQEMVKMKKYDCCLMQKYDKNDFEQMEKIIKHENDMKFSYAAVKQLEGKYLVQDRVTGKIYESAQFLYILIAASLFCNYPKSQRMHYIRRLYNAVSSFKISLPTPIMAGVRTPTKQFSSCVLIECDDNLNSINATSSAIIRYVAQRAGIGINAGKMRAIGSSIRNGEALHTGCIPFYKHFQTAVKSCSQGGVRGGAATLFYPIWHLEVESLLVLKNNRGTESNRVRHIDYGVQLNKLMYERFLKGEKITLFSPSDTPDMYEAFFNNQEKFNQLYVDYERNKKIKKKSVKALELFSLMLQERSSTGRIYIQNVDHCNTHSAFNPSFAPVRQSNLCMEITLPTSPLNNIEDQNGEVALCTLAALNLGAIKNIDEIESLASITVHALDSLLDYQNYLIPAARNGALGRRPLGIGVINFAYYLAKNNLSYAHEEAKNLTHKTFEAIQFYLLKSSNELAKIKGVCSLYYQTNYAKGILPIDSYKKDIDDICQQNLQLDWELLRRKIKKNGLRNSTLSAIMPSETSSQIANATNGIEPPRGLMSIKSSKDGILRQVVPECLKLNKKYQLLWDVSNADYLKIVGIIQKFVDQSISANTNYDPKKFKGGKIPISVLLKDLLIAYKLGLKTLYYQNTRDGAKDQSTITHAGNRCESDACEI